MKHIKRPFRLLAQKLILPISTEPDVRRREFILNVLLAGTILLLAWCDLFLFGTSALRGASYRGIPPFFLVATTLFYVGLLALSRKGFLKTATAGLIGSLFLWTTYGAYLWGPDLQPIIISYVLIIFISGILVNARTSFLVTTAVGAVMLTLIFLQHVGAVAPKLYWKYEQASLRDVTHYTISFFVIAIVAWLSNREHVKSLKRAQESERQLMKERDMLEDTVTRRTEEIRQLQAEKIAQLYHFAEFGKLSSGLFHDLVSPLTVVTASIESLSSEMHPDLPGIKQQLELSFRASKKMERFITAVKRQIRIDDFKEEFQANSIIEDVLALFHHKAAKAGVDLIFDAKEKVVLTQNPLKFQQAVGNLVSNAIDSYDGMERPPVLKRAYVSLSSTSSKAVIRVRDFGKGIPKDILPVIFDSFFTTKARQGTGLGLSNTKRIVQKDLGGMIEVSSTEGQGTQFKITIPLSS